MRYIILLIICIVKSVNAQYGIEWEKSYGGLGSDGGIELVQTIDNGYLFLGSTNSNSIDVSNSYGDLDFWVVKIDQLGQIQWEKNYGGTNWDNPVSILKNPNDNEFILVGTTLSNDQDISNLNGFESDIWVVKIDSIGNIIWEETFGGTGADFALSANPTSIGYIISGTSNSIDGDVSSNYGNLDAWIIHIDNNGDILWEKNYGGSGVDYGNYIEPTNDGGFILGAETVSTDFDVSNNNGGIDFWAVKMDSIGNVEWEKNYGGSADESIKLIKQTDDSGFILTGYTTSNNGDFNSNYGFQDYGVLRLDSIGNIIWAFNYGSSGNDYPSDLEITSYGSFIITGISDSNNGDVMGNYGLTDVWLLEIDDNGQILNSENFGGTNLDLESNIVSFDDNEFILIGGAMSNDFDVSNNYGESDVWLVKLKSLIGKIEGNVYLDNNENCSFDLQDFNLSNTVIVANNTATNQNSYAFTDTNGYFEMDVDTAIYNLTYITPIPYFESSSCSFDTLSVNITDTNLQDTTNFYLKPTIECPYLQVNIGAPILRRCMSTDFVISYCNNGTVEAENAFIEVEFDEDLIINSSTLPWTSVNQNIYTFDIGNVAIFNCGSFSVNVTVDCNSTFIGQALCSEARIFPDTFCLPTPTNWNGAELLANATCLGMDSAQFTIKNIGDSDMTEDSKIIVVEDILLEIEDFIQLDAGDSIIFTIPISGISQRIIAYQPTGHPFKTFTTDVVSLCNIEDLNPNNPILDPVTYGYQNDDESPFISIDCQPIIGDYDPNAKSVFPSGVTSENFIDSSASLEYKIHFQNTGNSIAHNIVVTDTISPYLDITSFYNYTPTASHPYEVSIVNNNVLVFSFLDINLVDSNTNELESHGFIQFTLNQNTSNNVGDVILNSAEIKFDYNSSIVTNEVFNKIGSIYIDTLNYTSIVDNQVYDIQVFPNPMQSVLNFDLGNSFEKVDIEIYNMQGSLTQKISKQNTNLVKLYREKLSTGFYFFRIILDDKRIVSGKIQIN